MSDQERSTVPPLLNHFMSAVLRSPLHPMASRSVMLITFTGRKSGKTYTTPISYARDGDLVTAFTGARWWRNLEGGAPVTLFIKRQELQGWALPVAEDKQAVADGLQAFLRQVRTDARFYGVTHVPPAAPPGRRTCASQWLCPKAAHHDSWHQPTSPVPERRQPAEGGAGEVAGKPVQDPDL